MKKWLIILSVITVLILALSAVILIKEELEFDSQLATRPILNNNKKWRIGYIEGGQFSHYSRALKSTIDGLTALGWMKPVDWKRLSPDADNAELVWNFLADNVQSDYLIFQKDAFCSGKWNKEQRALNRKYFLYRLKETKDIDLVLAMGTWAGQDLANNLHATPIVIIGSINPDAAGIVSAEDNTSLPHIFVSNDPQNIIRQIRIFHLLVNFKKLGVVYDSSSAGKIYSCVNELRKVAGQKKIKLIEAPIRMFDLPPEQAEANLLSAYKKLAPEVDAMWITSNFIDTPMKANKLLKPFFEYNIPTWSPYGESSVSNGVTFGVVESPKELGLWHAAVIAKILNGALPCSLSTQMPKEYELYINNAAAQKINFDIPRGLLFATDKSYVSINRGKKDGTIK